MGHRAKSQLTKPIVLNYADEIEKAEVRTILSELPAHHPAVLAWRDGNGAEHVRVSHLLPHDRPDLIERMNASMMAGYGRYLHRTLALDAGQVALTKRGCPKTGKAAA